MERSTVKKCSQPGSFALVITESLFVKVTEKSRLGLGWRDAEILPSQ
jgi:hypothetical protein